MASSLTVSKTFAQGGKSYSESGSVSGVIDLNPEWDVAPAQAGTLASGGTTTSGSVTMVSAAHGITTSSRIDVYWSGGCLIGATVGTVSGLTVPITASGTFYPSSVTALPANSTALTLMNPTQRSLALTGNNVQGLVHSLTVSAANKVATFTYCNGSTIVWIEQVPFADVDAWYAGGPGVNPLAGLSVTQVYVSHNDTVNTAKLRAALLSN